MRREEAGREDVKGGRRTNTEYKVVKCVHSEKRENDGEEGK